MVALTPTVHERLSRCGRHVHVDGLVGGLTELTVLTPTGTQRHYQVEGVSGAYDFVVEPLVAGATVLAKQTVGGETTPESPPVVVEDVHLPPDTAPRLPESIDTCAHCVGVDGIVPGADVELKVAGAVVGRGIAGRDGSLCVGLAAPAAGETRSGQQLTARMIVCDQESPPRQAPFLPPGQRESSFPPYVGPLFDCQSSVPLGNLTPGAEVVVETESGEMLGGFESCWTSVNLWGIRELHSRTPDRVRARQRWRRTSGCEREDSTGLYTDVVPLTDDMLRPIVGEALVDGAEWLWVEQQRAGATLWIHVTRGTTTVDYGPRPAGSNQKIALNEALLAGDVVTVSQELCGRSAMSVPVTVQALPTTLAPPIIVPPLYECGAAVRVSNLAAGALVRVYQERFPIGVAWAGMEPSIKVIVRPSLRADAPVTAVQFVGALISAPSAEVSPGRLGTALEPRLLEPIAAGESEVWVSHVAPGSIVTVRSGPTVIGEIEAAESIVRVPVTSVPPFNTITTSARLCGTPVYGSNTVQPIQDPGLAGTLEMSPTRQRLKVYSTELDITGESLVTPLQGIWYEPEGRADDQLAQLPLVLVAHGMWNSEPDPELSYWSRSFRGYSYLAEHLVSWGMRVFSLDLASINQVTSTSRPRQGARAALILRALEAIANDEYRPSWRGNSRMRIALIGHSMGGEAVLIARNRAFGQPTLPNVSGVVSIAPTTYERLESPGPGAYLQLIGSNDILVRSNDAYNRERFAMFQEYDRGARVKTHYWIYGARHNGFNRSWLGNNDNERSVRETSLDPETAGNDFHVEHEADLIVAPTHERLAKALITPFLVQVFELPVRFGAAAYGRYLTGAILPPSIRDVTVHTQHAGPVGASTTVVDNFGDADEVAALGEDLPINKIQNRMGLEARGEGEGLRSWEDVRHSTLPPNIDTPHATISTWIKWADAHAEYRTAVSLMRPPSSDSVLSLRVGQARGTDVTLNPFARALDFFVALRDAMGVEAVVRLGAVAPVPFPPPERCPMRTVRIPIDAFTAVAPELALNRLESITFRFTARPTGDVFIDDVEFTAY